MRKIIPGALTLLIVTFLFSHCNPAGSTNVKQNISFYDVPLICGADPTIGCGSRIKPLFIESAKHNEIKESWTNRQGTVIAFTWAEVKPDNGLAEKLFRQFEIEGSLITDENKITELAESMRGKQQWYEGMAVDSLSLHEAETIASASTQIIADAGLITAEEASVIRPEIENYFKKELVQVRTFDKLLEDERNKWMYDSFKIYASHIGADRAEKVQLYYLNYQQKKVKEKESCTQSCNDKKDCCTKK